MIRQGYMRIVVEGLSADAWIMVPEPPVRRRCWSCLREWLPGNVKGVISQNGIEHKAEDHGMTACGLDATGFGWWWPL